MPSGPAQAATRGMRNGHASARDWVWSWHDARNDGAEVEAARGASSHGREDDMAAARQHTVGPRSEEGGIARESLTAGLDVSAGPGGVI